MRTLDYGPKKRARPTSCVGRLASIYETGMVDARGAESGERHRFLKLSGYDLSRPQAPEYLDRHRVIPPVNHRHPHTPGDLHQLYIGIDGLVSIVTGVGCDSDVKTEMCGGLGLGIFSTNQPTSLKPPRRPVASRSPRTSSSLGMTTSC